MRDMAVGSTRGTELLRGVLDLCLLAVIDEGPKYGDEMTKRLRERGLAFVGEGSIYPLLAAPSHPPPRHSGHLTRPW